MNQHGASKEETVKLSISLPRSLYDDAMFFGNSYESMLASSGVVIFSRVVQESLRAFVEAELRASAEGL